MPPLPYWFTGKASFVPGLQAGVRDAGEWRLVAEITTLGPGLFPAVGLPASFGAPDQ